MATIEDGLEDVDTVSRFDGMPGHGLYAFVTTNPDVVQSSQVINDWVVEQTPNLPEGATLSFWRDAAVPFKGRVETLHKKGFGGLLLVFLVGALFATGGRNMGVCWDCGRILGRFLSPALHRRGAEYDFTVCLFVGAGHCGG